MSGDLNMVIPTTNAPNVSSQPSIWLAVPGFRDPRNVRQR
jgi:hypothetical protein